MYKLKYRLQFCETQKATSEKIGITADYLSQIQKGRACSKLVAYAITKVFNEDDEILDLFENVIKE